MESDKVCASVPRAALTDNLSLYCSSITEREDRAQEALSSEIFARKMEVAHQHAVPPGILGGTFQDCFTGGFSDTYKQWDQRSGSFNTVRDLHHIVYCFDR